MMGWKLDIPPAPRCRKSRTSALDRRPQQLPPPESLASLRPLLQWLHPQHRLTFVSRTMPFLGREIPVGTHVHLPHSIHRTRYQRHPRIFSLSPEIHRIYHKVSGKTSSRINCFPTEPTCRSLRLMANKPSIHNFRCHKCSRQVCCIPPCKPSNSLHEVCPDRKTARAMFKPCKMYQDYPICKESSKRIQRRVGHSITVMVRVQRTAGATVAGEKVQWPQRR